MTQDIWPEAGNRVRSLFGDLAGGRWERARLEFDADLRGHADADKVARAWTSVARLCGGFEGTGDASARRSGGHAVIDVPLGFHAGNATGRVVLDHAGKVSGLRVEYPRRHRMDPRRVRFFVLGNGSQEVVRALRLPG